MQKILYLVTQSEFGGAQKYIADLAVNLSPKEFIVEIAVGERKKEIQNSWLKTLENQGFKVWRLRHVIREINLWHDFLSIFELYALFNRSKPDIIHLNSSKIGAIGSVVGWFYKKISGRKVKIIYTAHGFIFNEPMMHTSKLFYLWSEKVASFFRDKIICVSETDKIAGLNHKIANHNKFVTIHNGVDLQKISFLDKHDARKELLEKMALTENGADFFYVGTVANLYETKGLIFLVRAAKILVDKTPGIVFLLIGEGEERKKIEKEIKSLALSRHFFLLGSLTEAVKYLKAFDLFCLSSIKEGFPYTLLEAMAAGLPIVTTTVGGIPEIVADEVNGLIVPKEKPREIAKAIEKFWSDKIWREKISQNNLKKIKEFSLEKMVGATESVYYE